MEREGGWIGELRGSGSCRIFFVVEGWPSPGHWVVGGLYMIRWYVGCLYALWVVSVGLYVEC